MLAVAVPKDVAFLAMRRALELLGEEEGTAKGAPTVIYMYPRLPGPLMCVDRPANWSTCLPGWPAEILRRIAEEFGGKIVEVPWGRIHLTHGDNYFDDVVLQASCSELLMPITTNDLDRVYTDFLMTAHRLGALLTREGRKTVATLGCAKATFVEHRLVYSHEACLDMFPLLAELSLRYGFPVCTMENDIEPFAFIDWLEAEGYRYKVVGPCVFVKGRQER